MDPMKMLAGIMTGDNSTLVRVLLLSRLELPDTVSDTYNYRASGDVDSIEFVRFILGIENDFGITLSDADVENPAFSTVGGAVKIIESKL